MSKMMGAVTVSAVLLGLTSMARADSGDESNNSNVACPVGLVSGMTLTDEFGADAAANTRCIKKRHEVKLVFQINNFCESEDTPNASCTAAYALNQMTNVLNDYDITDGMVAGRDYNVIAVVHGPGGRLLVKDGYVGPNGVANQNQFQSQVQGLMARGVTFYFCENTVRGLMKAGILQKGNVSAGVIDGVKYVTAGVAALSDFQALGYSYVQP
jgi:intracellular sulfur oxidation DsrE/DsrF family protein